MARRIEGEIVDFRVRKGSAPAGETAADGAAASGAETAPTSATGAGTHAETAERQPDIVAMDETLARPYVLLGSTYKVKTPVSDHAMYITINDMVLNESTENEVRRPFEIFINSKNLDHFQWIVALTRIISAVFRKGGDVTFLVEELKAVFDPRGGYWKTGGKFMPSLIAEIGEVIEQHLTKIGMIKPAGLSDHQKKLLAEKRAQYESAQAQGELFVDSQPGNAPVNGATSGSAAASRSGDVSEKSPFPAGASLCAKCNTAAVVLLDGCRTCLSCGDSKCG